VKEKHFLLFFYDFPHTHNSLPIPFRCIEFLDYFFFFKFEILTTNFFMNGPQSFFFHINVTSKLSLFNSFIFNHRDTFTKTSQIYLLEDALMFKDKYGLRC